MTFAGTSHTVKKTVSSKAIELAYGSIGDMRPDLAFGGIFFLTCLGLSVFGFVTMMEKILIPWRISLIIINN